MKRNQERTMQTFWKTTLAAAALIVPSLAMADTWVTDPASTRVSFTVSHLMVSVVEGQFGKVSAIVKIDDADLARSTVEANIDAASINTGHPNRDDHLRSPDFFDVDKYPVITFKSKKVEQVASGKLTVTGELTLCGVTKEVVLDVTGPSAEQKEPGKPGTARRSVSATTRISRRNFGLNWSRVLEAGGVAVSDDVNITLALGLVRDTKAPAATKGAKGAR
jgi:polyisoprenoid-binding protein YceI